MKTIVTALLVVCLGILMLTAKNAVLPKSTSGAYPGFSVLELFTSEGCSSCPTADALIARIQRENSGKAVYILAYHVDYWDRLGWKDSFSDPNYSKRQRQYAHWLNLETVYTPQVVANGRQEFVGSQETTMRNTIKRLTERSSSSTLLLTQVKTSPGQISLQYRTDDVGDHAALVLALVQKNAISKVRKGENAGKTLPHVQIVRALRTISLGGKREGTGQLAIPTGLEESDLEVVGFVQNSENGEITAAKRVGLDSSDGMIRFRESSKKQPSK